MITTDVVVDRAVHQRKSAALVLHQNRSSPLGVALYLISNSNPLTYKIKMYRKPATVLQ